ncbi:pyocin S6 family toxin immunity protein [Pseudomonas sp. LB3P31]
MKYDLKFQIYGIDPDSDRAEYEIGLPATVTAHILMPIMGWREEEQAMGSHPLTAGQIRAIEGLLMFRLPKNLILHISSYM